MVMPNFLIIGAQKAGTSSLYHYLKQHPQVYMSPIKEPKFFALEGEEFDPERRGSGGLTKMPGIRDLETYQQQYEGVSNEIAIGEASPLYIYVPKAVERIKHYIPDAKLVAILRHPVDRAYSNFIHWVQRGLEPLDSDFESIIQEEETRISQNWSPNYHYKNRGFYYEQLKRYFDVFDKEQIRVYLYDDFIQNPQSVVQDIFRFIDVDDDFIPNTGKKYNVSKIPRSGRLNSLLKKPSFFKSILKPILPKILQNSLKEYLIQANMTKPQLSPGTRKKLMKYYKDDIEKLQDLIQKDLSQWLE